MTTTTKPKSDQKPKSKESSDRTEVILEMPILYKLPNIGHRPSKLELRLYGLAAVRDYVKSLSLSLESNGATLSSGKHVRGCSDAVVWLLEQHVAAM